MNETRCGVNRGLTVKRENRAALSCAGVGVADAVAVTVTGRVGGMDAAMAVRCGVDATVGWSVAVGRSVEVAVGWPVAVAVAVSVGTAVGVAAGVLVVVAVGVTGDGAASIISDAGSVGRPGTLLVGVPWARVAVTGI